MHCDAVYQVARAVQTPVIGIGGIATLNDVMEFLVAGATAVQLGTVNLLSTERVDRNYRGLPAALAESGAKRIADIVGTLVTPNAPASCR